MLETARQQALNGQPQELARLMYGGRMGNDDAGDGYLYRGRGYVMLTGEENYRDAGEGVDLDLVANPGLAAEPEHAARIAVWYWRERVPAEDRDDVSAATVAINGGTNGLADRHNRFDAWHALLTPEFMADLDAGRVQAGEAVAPRERWAAMADGALRRGETGVEVGRLQENLRELDIQDVRGREPAANQTYGASTEQAVRNFQRQQALPVTGRADPDTLDAIGNAIEARHAHPAAPAVPPRGAPPVEEGGGIQPRTQLHEQAEAAVRRLDASLGKTYDNSSECMTASLACLAKENGLERIDHVLLSVQGNRLRAGENVFVVQGELTDPAKRLAYMKTQDAIAAPIDQSMAQYQALQSSVAPTQVSSMEQPLEIAGLRLRV